MKNQLFVIETLKNHDGLMMCVPVLGREEYPHEEFMFNEVKDLRVFMATWRYHDPLTAIRHYNHQERMALLTECYG